MNEIEKRFMDRVGQSLERYCPNDSVLNNLSTYLIREAVEVLNEFGIADIKGFESNSDIDKLAFLHAVKDLSLFSAIISARTRKRRVSAWKTQPVNLQHWTARPR